MQRYQFKKGDKIKRINCNFGVTKVGEVYTVTDINNLSLKIEEDNTSRTYDILNFELVEVSNNIPEFLN